VPCIAVTAVEEAEECDIPAATITAITEARIGTVLKYLIRYIFFSLL
jgi:hypothetical protein